MPGLHLLSWEFIMSTKQCSTNERAEKLVGRRDEYLSEGTIIFDAPLELGYICPACKFEQDEYLEWSEYQGFIWCGRCDKDYPSALCQLDIDRSIKTYLDTVEEAIQRSITPQIKKNEVDLRLFFVEMKNGSIAYDIVSENMKKRGWTPPEVN